MQPLIRDLRARLAASLLRLALAFRHIRDSIVAIPSRLVRAFCDLRAWLAAFPLALALTLLPANDSRRIGIMRGLQEQREYERYEGYTLLLRQRPLFFHAWREVRQTMRARLGRVYPRPMEI